MPHTHTSPPPGTWSQGRDARCIRCLPGDQTSLEGGEGSTLNPLPVRWSRPAGAWRSRTGPKPLTLALSSQSPRGRGGAGGSSWQKEGLQLAEEPRPPCGRLREWRDQRRGLVSLWWPARGGLGGESPECRQGVWQAGWKGFGEGGHLAGVQTVKGLQGRALVVWFMALCTCKNCLGIW